jgi:hypothetical protein
MRLWSKLLEWLFCNTFLGYFIKIIAEMQCELLSEGTHPKYGDVLYCAAWTTKLLNREAIALPDVFLVPNWYMHIGIQAKLRENHFAYGRCLHDMDTKHTTIMLNRRYVDVEGVFGGSVLVHELVHSVQYADGRGQVDESILELEARIFQEEFCTRHKKLIDDVQKGIMPLPVQSLGEPK